MKMKQSVHVLLTLVLVGLISPHTFGQATKTAGPDAKTTEQPNTDPALTKSDNVDLQHKEIVRKGLKYLLEKGQAEDGSFSKQLSPAVTALCASALIENGVPLTDERVQKSLKFIESQIKPDGGIYAKGSTLRNYETSVAVMVFTSANVEGNYDNTIQKAVSFLKGIQWDEAEGHTIDSNHYGGQGYGSHNRPDMSNTSFFQDALIKAGVDPKSQAFRNSTTFMARGQNLSTRKNTAEWAKVVSEDDKGGFIYTPVGPGESKAGETEAGGLRSYASMTYAGLKSMLYAGVEKDDIRVKAAMDWIGRHYDLTTNPGMGHQGLYYYYHVFAKTLDASNENMVVDKDGKSHNWRADLVRQLAKTQSEDGSWTNPADRWYEGDPNLVTAYSMLALSYCDQPSKERVKADSK
ncbi:MAG: prenyltransferase/squalene oxidase repeat-containing protein [Mariniblastus sp.]